MANASCLDILDRTDLFRLILNRIWVRYSASGISDGRSLRAGLLEGIINLIPLQIYVEGYDLEDFLESASRKGALRWDGQLLLNLGIRGLPAFYLFLFLIREMQVWYEWDEANSDSPLRTEKKQIDILAEYMGVKEHLRQFDDAQIRYTPRQLIDEANDRRTAILLYETTHGLP